MRNLLLLTVFAFALSILTGCQKDEVEPIVDEAGLTREIKDLVPAYILQEMQTLGMPIHGGASPPNIENSFLASPCILLSSNRPGDNPGYQFADFRLTFSQQDNKALSIMVDYVNGPESGTGLGSFIVGSDESFTVFVEVNSLYGSTEKAKLVYVFSGDHTTTGIEDLHIANFMIDNNGNPSGVWIENGEGRVIHDQDGFSEVL